ncbi:hypothetical protein ACNKHP_09195 [Shigella boydii]
MARLAVRKRRSRSGASSLAAGHKTLFRELVEALKKWDAKNCAAAGRHSTAG